MTKQGNRITEERVIVKADTNLYFPGVEKFRQVLNEAIDGEAQGRSSCLLVDLSNVTEIDFSALKVGDIVRGDRTHVGRFQHFRYNTFNICPITFLTNAMNEAWPSLPPDFFSEYSVANFFLKLILKFLTILDTTGVILDRSLSHVGQSRYGQ